MRKDDVNQLKISAPLPFRQTYRLIPLSAKSISLDSLFKAGARSDCQHHLQVLRSHSSIIPATGARMSPRLNNTTGGLRLRSAGGLDMSADGGNNHQLGPRSNSGHSTASTGSRYIPYINSSSRL
jgi:hypothetical protein